MSVYVDSSVFMRFVMQQPDRLDEVSSFDERITSQLTQAECLRTLDKAMLTRGLTPEGMTVRATVVHHMLRQTRRVRVTRSVLDRAGSAFPLPIRTLDAIHLATALQIRDRGHEDLLFATHDRLQGKTALALGFRVLGL